MIRDSALPRSKALADATSILGRRHSNIGRLVRFFLGLLAVVGSGEVRSDESAARALPAVPLPLEVDISFELVDLLRVDDEAETFEFSGVLTLQWKDPRQAFDPAVEGVSEKFYHGDFQFNEMAPSWYPQVILANASSVPESQGILQRVLPDGSCTLVQDLHATARTPLALQKYPFDRQRLLAEFHVLGFDVSEVVLTESPTNMVVHPDRINIPEWKLESVSAEIDRYPDSPRSTLSLSFVVARQWFFVVRLVILPMFFIVALSWCVFWMDRASLGDRMSVSFVGILTATTYQAMVSDSMPHIAYHSFIKAYLNFAFLVMSATAAVNVVVCICDRHGRVELGDTLDRRSRWIFPLAFGLLIAIAGIDLL